MYSRFFEGGKFCDTLVKNNEFSGEMLYICRIIITGWRRALQSSDLWSLNPSDRSQMVAPKLANSWQRQLNKSRSAIT